MVVHTVTPCLINEWVENTRKVNVRAYIMHTEPRSGFGFYWIPNSSSRLCLPSHILSELIIPTNDNDLVRTEENLLT